jgi:hypothetical protein
MPLQESLGQNYIYLALPDVRRGLKVNALNQHYRGSDFVSLIRTHE